MTISKERLEEIRSRFSNANALFSVPRSAVMELFAHIDELTNDRDTYCHEFKMMQGGAQRQAERIAELEFKYKCCGAELSEEQKFRADASAALAAMAEERDDLRRSLAATHEAANDYKHEFKMLQAGALRQANEIDRLKRIIAKELSENDELGSEFVYVMVLKEQLAASQARVARLEEALNDVFSVLNSPLEPNTKGVFDQNSQMASKAHTAWVILREALNTPESPDSSKGA